MSTHITLKDFEEIYKTTYNKVLQYVICKCENIDDINDILQNTYTELYSILRRKKELKLDNPTSYIVGIAKKKIIKHYGILYKFKTASLDMEEDLSNIPDNINIEEVVIIKSDSNQIWRWLKQKNDLTQKIFYLYYGLDLKIKDIAKELNLTEANVKNIIYRTVNKLKEELEEKESDIDE